MSGHGKIRHLFAPDYREGGKADNSFSVISFLTKTALFGGIASTCYYFWNNDIKIRRAISKLLDKPIYILHCYDHCPYSIRVELALAFLGVPYTRALYGYGDVKGPTQLIGKKQLPVLEYMGKYTPESEDIIDLIEKNTADSSIPPRTNRKDLERWLEDTREIRQNLCRPRKIKVPIKDWANNRDVEYARQKYEKMGFNYTHAEARSDDLIAEMNRLLETFNDNILYDENSVNELGFGWDDILVIPNLRTLTCVKGLKWPSKLRKYLENAFKDVIAELYFKHAV
jgi:glutaredoxin 2